MRDRATITTLKPDYMNQPAAYLASKLKKVLLSKGDFFVNLAHCTDRARLQSSIRTINILVCVIKLAYEALV